MGQVNKPNLALITNIIIKLLDELQNEIKLSQEMESRFDIILFGTYIVVSYVISLRGSEGLMINLTTIKKELEIK